MCKGTLSLSGLASNDLISSTVSLGDGERVRREGGFTCTNPNPIRYPLETVSVYGGRGALPVLTLTLYGGPCVASCVIILAILFL